MLGSGRNGLLIALQVPSKMEEGIQVRADEVGVSKSEIIRRAVTSYLSGRKLTLFLGIR